MSPDPELRRQQKAGWYARNREAIRKDKARSYAERRALHLCWEARRRAKRKRISFTLTESEIADLQRRINLSVCEMTGTNLDLSQGRKWNAPSIDRIDCAKGYEHGNLRIICHAMNAALGDWGEDALRQLLGEWQSTLRKRRNLSAPTGRQGHE